YMYRMYAAETRARINLGIRRRLAPLLENDRRKIELLNALLFSLPGTPVIYYGDEIGMGDNIYLGDRDAVRTPFQWSADRNAGFSRANPQKLFLPVIIDPEYHFESVNVEAQNNNPSSLLWWMKRIVGLRKQHRALQEGELEFIYPENRKMLVFLRRYEDEKILVVANLSRHVQYVELELEEFEGLVPMELFGHTRFPPIGELPYFLTLAPYSFYWFELTSEEEENGDAEFKPPLLENVRSIRDFFPARKPGVVQNEIVPNWLRHARWFAGKNRRITGISIIESIILSEAHGGLLSLLVQVEYTEGESEIYQVLLTRSYEDQADEILEEHPRSVLARLNTPGEKEPIGILHDALVAPRTAEFLLDIIKKRRRFKGEQGHLSGAPEKAFRRIEKEKAEAGDDISDEPDILRGEQSNTSIAYGEKFILKFFRRLEEGTNPDLEIGKYFQDRTRFRYVPSVAGS
ncbi:MAG: alpha-glucosidase C-terminal domain-containing protein, partial [Leptospiraceae bacterium]|nr:alpha-glucosidase C-terminal domain-containing protein [Leptospiraceae bacterium]